ncbi:MAG TPA: CU044_5270 family protein [Solirubrobacterales bacterium]|nr:CU044_5270 family protein [Solirubrobacterales bacterium]
MRLRDAERALAAANPVGERYAHGLDLSAGEEMLLAAIVAEPRPPAAPRRKRRAVTRPALVAAVAMVVALATLVVGLPGGGDERSSRGGLAVLDRVAAAAAEQPPPDAALPYGYLKTRGNYLIGTQWGGESWSAYSSEVAETWAAADGSGRRRTVSFVPGFVSPADRAAWERAGKPPFLAHGWGRHVGTEAFPPGTFSGVGPLGTDLDDLPTDPEELSRWLVDRVTEPASRNGFPPEVRVLTLAAELLQNPFSPPELRAALYEAVALVPGIEDLGRARDQLGREGIAVGARSANSGAPTVYSLIVDPETSAVLATEQKQLQAPPALPELDEPLVSSTAYLASERTAAALRPPPASARSAR